jgi:hypothetical protein
MSPNAYVCVGKNGLLFGYPGEEENEKPSFTWTYDDFEEYVNDCITPSMYRFMVGYVKENISKDELYEIQGGDYCPGQLEEDAVDAYFDLPTLQKIDLHDTTLQNLKNEKNLAEAKYTAAISMPVIEKSPIAKEYAEFVQGLVERYQKLIERLEREIHEEEQWRGGHEAGAENDV